jgi:peroxiredoxin family protein
MDTAERRDTLAIVLCSGTDDRLTGAAVLAVGAAVMERPVEILLQFWALDAFRADRITKDHGVSPEAGVEGRAAWDRRDGQHWSEMLRQAKEFGDVSIHACSLSMETLGITQEDLDPLVDDVEGIAAFIASADEGITFV